MTEYKSNSHRSKNEERAKIEPVAKAKKAPKKDTSIKGILLGNVPNVKEYNIDEVLIPCAKKAISEIVGSSTDMISDAIDVALFGEKRRRSSRNRYGSKISYYKYYEDRDRRSYERERPARVRGYDFDDIILETKDEAYEVLDRMEDLLDQYKLVSVADLYDLVGISGDYTDNKYGWTNLRNARVERLRYEDGYILKLPKALPLD